MGRHHGGRGFGRFAAGFTGRFGRGGDEFRSGRKLAAADLQLLLLALLQEQPSHGYELIKLLEERSSGFYSPSPGVIYPALTYLEEIGYVQAQVEGSRKRYELTAAGLEYLQAHRATADAILEGLARVGARMQRVREAFSDPQAAWEEHLNERGRGRHDELARAHHALREALHRAYRAAPEERQRIAAILQRAADEILGRAP
jgi:DNA-binding PadR family transcriptional regulator